MNLLMNALLIAGIGAGSWISQAQAGAAPLVPEAGGSLCYKRIYTDAHLQKNPLQQVTAIKLLLSSNPQVPGLVSNRLLISLRGDSENDHWSNGGNCWVAANSNSVMSCNFDEFRGEFSLTSRSDGTLLVKVRSMSVYSDQEDRRHINPDSKADGVLLLYPDQAQHCQKEADGSIDGFGER